MPEPADLTAAWAATTIVLTWVCTYAALAYAFKPKWRRRRTSERTRTP